jgi:hypothetical protein
LVHMPPITLLETILNGLCLRLKKGGIKNIMSIKNENERGWVGQLTVKLNVTDCTGTVND